MRSVPLLLAGCLVGLAAPAFAAGLSRCSDATGQAATRGGCAVAVSDAVPKSRPRAASLADRVAEAMARGDDAAALADVQAALAADSRSAAAARTLVLRGQIEASRSRHLSALTDFTAALKLDSTLVLAYEQRGLVHFRQHNHDAARADAETALRLDASAPSARGLRGIVLAAKGEWTTALPDIDAAIAGGVAWPEVHNDRGRALMHEGDAARALVAFERATTLSPRNAAYLVNRGLAFQRLNRGTDALASYSAAILAGPGYAPAYVARAAVLEERGSLHAARTDLRTARAMAPETGRETIDAALERIADRILTSVAPSAPAAPGAPKARDPLQGGTAAGSVGAGADAKRPQTATRTPRASGTAFGQN